VTHRVERINSLIQQELSDLLRRHVKDPRLGEFVTITEVVATGDLRHARVYVSRLSEREERDEIIGTLNAAANYLRTELGKRLRLRYVPEMSFHWDDSIERSERLQQIIDQINAEDSARAPGE
jgi:ribosome-binding factor A